MTDWAKGKHDDIKVLSIAMAIAVPPAIDGRFAGTWVSKRSGKRLVVTIEPFAELDRATLAAIEEEIADIGRFEGVAAELSP